MKEDFKIWWGCLVRGIVIAGLTFSANAVSGGLCWSSFEPAVIAGLGYMFIELARKYGIALQPKNKKGSYQFLILP